jgi:ADP-ribose pyrophosphatase YjhB (NUDIX family)
MDNTKIPHRPGQQKIVFETPWFKVLATAGESPHYLLQSPDFVTVVALDAQGRLLLVRQFRQGVGSMTLELPAGHVEAGETPEMAARKELMEETGHEASALELLGILSPSTPRFTNRLWCYFAPDTRPSHSETGIEAGIIRVYYTGSLSALLADPEFISTGSHAALLHAVVRGKLNFPLW